MSQIERNKQLAREFFDILTRCDIDGIINAYAEDGTVTTMGNTLISGTYNTQQIRAAAGAVLTVFPEGLRFTIHDLTAEDDRVAVRAESYGKHVSGVIYNNHYHFFMRYRDGKLVTLLEYMDTELITAVLCGGQRKA